SLIGRDGGEVETPFSAQEIGAGPGWSPDGRTLGFSAHGAGDDSGSATTSIRVLDLKTGKANVVPGSDGLHFTGWLPDGRYLAAFTVEGHRFMLFSRGSSQWQELTREYVDYPEWSRDSRYVYANTLMYQNPRVLRFRVQDGKAEEVFR